MKQANKQTHIYVTQCNKQTNKASYLFSISKFEFFIRAVRILTRDGYRLVFIRYPYIADTFRPIPVPKRCRNRYFYKKIKKCLRLTTFKKGFIAKYMNCLKYIININTYKTLGFQLQLPTFSDLTTLKKGFFYCQGNFFSSN